MRYRLLQPLGSLVLPAEDHHQFKGEKPKNEKDEIKQKFKVNTTIEMLATTTTATKTSCLRSTRCRRQRKEAYAAAARELLPWMLLTALV